MDPAGPRSDVRIVRAAAFLGQALGLTDDPGVLAGDLSVVEEDEVGAVYAGELDSSAGPAPFLVYVYDLGRRDAQGRSGRDRFAADLATLETAARLDTPGPRALAHADTGDDGFVLATSPATFRALTGASPAAAERRAEAAASAAAIAAARSEAAAELLGLLREADRQAEAWLTAVGGPAGSAGADPAPEIELGAFTPEETELALFLLDERSIRHLLRTLNAVLAEARARARGGGASGGGRDREIPRMRSE